MILGEPHLNAMKRVLRYLRGTTDLGLQLFRTTTSQLIAYSDADWAGCPATRRSTSGYCVFLGDNLLTWSSKRQDTLSRSSAEAEYRGVANAVAETSSQTDSHTRCLLISDPSNRRINGTNPRARDHKEDKPKTEARHSKRTSKEPEERGHYSYETNSI
ncbi:ribonuclease H-like domain-containing protein [Tanacetum coccineum]